MRRMLKPIALMTLVPLALACGSSAAENRRVKEDLADDPRAIAAGFLNFHPDLQYRSYGIAAYGKQDHERALMLFRRAAFYADKPSQAMIGEMHARGEGVPRDRALAYAWMDLAAERGYIDFIALRERYWRDMDAGEQARALVEGEAIYARYGDAAAKPRFAAQLRKGSKEGVGSRTGFVNNVKISIPGPSGGETIDGSKFKDISYWDAAQYWAMQDRIWRNPAGARVNVGDIQTLADDAARPSRIPPTAPELDAVEPVVPDEPQP